jgi:hypothetical protein
MAVLVPTQQPGIQQVLFRLIGANMNVTTDQAFVPYLWTPGQNFLIERIRVVNASVSLTTAAGGIYTAASKGGNAIVAASQAYLALTGSSLGLDATLAAVGAGLQTATPILSLTTAQGAAATADFYIFGSIVGNL